MSPPSHRPPPRRGDVWLVDLEPVRGHEQGRRRPALVLSVDAFNAGPAALCTVLPITSRDRGIRSHVPIDPPDRGLRSRSFALCEQVRTISHERLVSRWGRVSAPVMVQASQYVRFLLGL